MQSSIFFTSNIIYISFFPRLHYKSRGSIGLGIGIAALISQKNIYFYKLKKKDHERYS